MVSPGSVGWGVRPNPGNRGHQPCWSNVWSFRALHTNTNREHLLTLSTSSFWLSAVNILTLIPAAASEVLIVSSRFPFYQQLLVRKYFWLTLVFFLSDWTFHVLNVTEETFKLHSLAHGLVLEKNWETVALLKRGCYVEWKWSYEALKKFWKLRSIIQFQDVIIILSGCFRSISHANYFCIIHNSTCFCWCGELGAIIMALKHS